VIGDGVNNFLLGTSFPVPPGQVKTKVVAEVERAKNSSFFLSFFLSFVRWNTTS
jgi:hypothetical protein